MMQRATRMRPAGFSMAALRILLRRWPIPGVFFHGVFLVTHQADVEKLAILVRAVSALVLVALLPAVRRL